MIARIVPFLIVLAIPACFDHESGSDPRNEGGADSEVAGRIDPEAPPPLIDENDPLADLTRPAAPKDSGSVLDQYLGDTVATLMVEGSEAIETATITREILKQLESEGLLARGRPEGLVRDLVLRMKEDLDAFRPPDAKARPLDDARRQMLRLLGKSYGDDLRRALSPKGAGGQHEGTLRKVPTIPADRLKPGHEALTWKRIGGFVFDKQKKILPPEILALNGEKVAIAGFLMPVAEFDDIHEFLLVDSLWTCCFGEPAAVNQVVIVTIAEGRPGVPFYQDPILVHGVFDVGVREDEGWVTSVYRLEADSVETLPRR